VTVNVIGWVKSWDPYPFILMNLLLSLLSAYTAPLIIMAQNRDAERDRLMVLEDCETNRQAAEQISKILKVLEEHGERLALLLERFLFGSAHLFHVSKSSLSDGSNLRAVVAPISHWGHWCVFNRSTTGAFACRARDCISVK
jgi:uncharacterized membrane protein